MYKLILLFLVIKSVGCDRSFKIVLDTTNSMNDELNIIRANINQVLNNVDANDFGNFVIVTFNDTGLPNIFMTTSAFTARSNRKLITHLNELRTSGGNKCPENSLTGIEAALNSTPEKESVIFVFTDAYAYDYDKYESVEKLCKETHSQVIFFLSGYCFPDIDGSDEGNVDVYYDLAKACPGAVLKFELIFELRQAFKFMKEIANVDWTDVKMYEFTDFKTYAFAVDSFTTDLILVVTGENPSMNVTIIYPGITSRSAKMDIVLQTKHALVMRLPHSAEIGDYTASIRGQRKMSVTVYERNFIPFEFGFSTMQPRNIRETSPRPIPGLTNYILINVDRSVKLRLLEWLVDGDSVKTILYLRYLSPGSYAASVYVHPDKSFRFWIVGEDMDTQQQVKSSSKFITPQILVNNPRNKAPEAEIMDKDLGFIEYETALKLACIVHAYPKPSIQWKDGDGTYLTSDDALLEIPFMYISYAIIPKVLKNATVTCYAQNSEGTASSSIDLFVNRTYSFDVIKSPQDATVEYQSSHYLYCQVEAYPKASVQWYLNSTLLDKYNSRITYEDNNIMIKDMGLDDVGEYECRAFNEVETRNFKAYVQISGLDLPELDHTVNTELTIKVGDSVDLECSVTKGKPTPEITWKYKSLQDYDFANLPYTMSAYGNKLHINSVETSNAGVYRCLASNAMGEDILDFNVNVKYPPLIKDKDQNNRIVVKGPNEVRMSCDVDAVPKASVRWEFIKDGVLKPLNQNHRTDENYNLYFIAQSSDSGEYHCIAENEVGRTEKIVTVHVQVRPFIKSPENKLIQAVEGASVYLVCQVLEGNPEPIIEWDFQALGSSAYNLYHRGNSTLQLNNINQYNAGTYVCNAKNSVGFDNIRYRVIVH